MVVLNIDVNVKQDSVYEDRIGHEDAIVDCREREIGGDTLVHVTKDYVGGKSLYEEIKIMTMTSSWGYASFY